MKYILKLLIIGVFSCSCLAQGQSENCFEIGSYNKVTAFSKLAKPGKISIFIVGTHWCKPCKILKRELWNVSSAYPDVDFYYIDMSEGNSYQELTKTPAYYVWRTVERLKEWPLICVYSPTTNLVKKFSPTQLETEGFQGTSYDKVLNIIARLRDYTKGFSPDIHLLSQYHPPLVQKTRINTVSESKIGADSTEQLTTSFQKCSKTHIVKKNENLTDIRKKYDIGEKEILAANPSIKDPNCINLDQEICIPERQVK